MTRIDEIDSQISKLQAEKAELFEKRNNWLAVGTPCKLWNKEGSLFLGFSSGELNKFYREERTNSACYDWIFSDEWEPLSKKLGLYVAADKHGQHLFTGIPDFDPDEMTYNVRYFLCTLPENKHIFPGLTFADGVREV